MKIKSKRELEDNLHSIGVAMRILTRLESDDIDVQSLYTAVAQLTQANNYVNQLIGAVTANRNVIEPSVESPLDVPHEKMRDQRAKQLKDIAIIVRDAMTAQEKLELSIAEEVAKGVTGFGAKNG